MTQVEFKEVPALPVRSHSGKWKPVTKKVKIVRSEEMHNEKKASDGEDGDAQDTAAEQAVSSEEALNVESIKEQMGLLAVEITESPEEKIKGLKPIQAWASCETFSARQKEASLEVQSAALITLLAIFKDILPGYPIRQLTEEEKNARTSKIVKAQRASEEAILNAYRLYVARLEEILKTIKRGDAQLLPVAVGCLSELAVCAGHFNFAEKIFTALVGQVFRSGQVAEVAIKAVERVFGEDQSGKATAQLTSLLSDTLHGRGYGSLTSARPIEAFLSIRSRSLYASKSHSAPPATVNQDVARLDAYRKQQGHLSKIQRKELRAHLAESTKTAAFEAEHSLAERQKWSTDTLKFVFRVLFGILKAVEHEGDGEESRGPSASMEATLPVVLKCLARFSTYLSVEFYVDLLVCLKRVISRGVSSHEPPKKQPAAKPLSRLSLLAVLHAIQVVLQIMTLQESAPSVKGMPVVDLKFYYDLLYRELPRLAAEAGKENCEWTSLEASLEIVAVQLFLSKRHVPAERVAAFAHRILSTAASLIAVPEATRYLVRLVYRLLERHERVRGLLDADGGGIGIGGAYRPDSLDPDFCNPFSKQLNVKALLDNKALPNECRQVLQNLQRLAQN